MKILLFHRMFHKISMYWSNIKLVQRLIIGCFVFLVIPVLTVGIILFSIVLPLAQNEGRDSLVGMVNQMNENIQFRVVGYQNILAQLALDPRLSATLTQEYGNLSDAVDGLQNINSLVQRINAYFPMRRICIFQDNPTMPEDLGSIYKLSRAFNEPWYKAMSSSPTKNFYWYLDSSTPGDSVLDLSVRVKDFMEYENNTIIVFQIPCNTLFNQMQNPLQEKQGWVMLLDQHRQYLADCQVGEAGEFVKEEPYLDSVYKNENGWIFTQISGKRSLVVYKTNNLGWKIISVVSQEALWQKIQLIRNVVILVSILFVVLSVFVLAAFGVNITKRLKRLLKSMNEVRNGNFSMQVALHGNDELTAVESEFNAMTRQLDVTLRDLAETRSWAEQEELRLLQAQINPHFLYNTLALVKYMAMDIDAKDICGIIDAISRFFRLALNRGIDVLKVKEELEHVQAYLEIHELRYPNRVTTAFEIDPQILDCTIIKMTLQPIVENALTHAFIKTSGCGSITITAGQIDGMLSLRVADNGCGMTDEMIEELLNGPFRDDKRRGFGVRNVHERLKRYYGDPYGLKIKSTVDAGTVVDISVPFHLAGGK
jgi:two-component system, sensor histidine kinase YesM